jgi:RNA polymerase sigma factor (TIGR02999 family)
MAAVPPPDNSPGPLTGVKRYLVEHYDELYGIAARQMARENPGHSLQATALMNEAVCQMLDPNRKVEIKDASHFLATANVMMQHILIDRARRNNAQKAGGQLNRQELNQNQVGDDNHIVELLILQEELQLLAKQDPQAAQVIQKRCEGYSIDEAAELLGLSRSTAYDLWNFGRAWLLQMFHQNSRN